MFFKFLARFEINWPKNWVTLNLCSKLRWKEVCILSLIGFLLKIKNKVKSHQMTPPTTL